MFIIPVITYSIVFAMWKSQKFRIKVISFFKKLGIKYLSFNKELFKKVMNSIMTFLIIAIIIIVPIVYYFSNKEGSAYVDIEAHWWQIGWDLAKMIGRGWLWFAELLLNATLYSVVWVLKLLFLGQV